MPWNSSYTEMSGQYFTVDFFNSVRYDRRRFIPDGQYECWLVLKMRLITDAFSRFFPYETSSFAFLGVDGNLLRSTDSTLPQSKDNGIFRNLASRESTR